MMGEEDVVEEIARRLLRVPSHHGFRALAVAGLKAHVPQQHRAAYERFEATLPSVSLFSFMHLIDVTLLVMKMASLLHEGPSIRGKCEALHRDLIRSEPLQENLILKSLFQAAEGSPKVIFNIVAHGSMYRNFGTLSCIDVGKREVIMRGTDCYPHVIQYSHHGSWLGLMDALGVDGEVIWDNLDEDHFEAVIRWS